MIRGETFLEPLTQAGFRMFSGVPCSYLTPLINLVIDSQSLRYVGAANEGDAVAIASGAELGGQRAVVLMQNSGLGNAVNPLTSLSAIFKIPLLLIVTHRGHPDEPPDEPQHDMMGRITPDLLELMEIPWEAFPDQEDKVGPVLDRVLSYLKDRRTPYALVMRKGAVEPYTLRTRPPAARKHVASPPASGPTSRFSSDDVLAAIQAAAGPTDALLATTGFTGRALYALADRRNQFYMVGSMGCASSMGLGLALAQPTRRVVVLDGDGALLMRMGALATIGHEQPANLVHVVLDNGIHESTGGQGTVSASVDLPVLARACGYRAASTIHQLDDLTDSLRKQEQGPTLLHVPTSPRASTKLPRPTVGPAAVADRFRLWLQESA